MKLIGSYTSPFVRKISVILLEKRIPLSLSTNPPYSESNGVARYNPLGKVPALVTDDGECWFDSPVIAQYLELLGVAPPMIPADPRAALRMRQLEALADGVMEAARCAGARKSSPCGPTVRARAAPPAGESGARPRQAGSLRGGRNATR